MVSDSVSDNTPRQPTALKYEDVAESLEATLALCQRLHGWAMRQLCDRCFILPLLDLVQYCKVTSLWCRSYLTTGSPLLPSELAQEQLSRGLGALGFDQDANPALHGATTPALLLAECKRRTVEVLDLLNNELNQLSAGRPVEKRERVESEATRNYDTHRYLAAATKVHNNIILTRGSRYAEEKRVRWQDEIAREILPSFFNYGERIFKKFGHGSIIESSQVNAYPGEWQIAQTLQEFLCLSTHWAEGLQSITDPLNIQLYETKSHTPYEDVSGAEVGVGAFGTVYKAKNTKTGAIVAVKRLSELYNRKLQNIVRKELGVLQICDHPNTVRLLDAYQINDQLDTFYLVMEPWAPYTLSKFVHQSDSQRCRDSPWFTQGSPRSERQVIRIFRGLADGLCYLHDKSIKHKDLKPDNILLYDDPHRGIRPVIADLGVSKIFKPGNPTDFNRSTYAYLAPEQVNCTGSTLRSDVWQLGCCFALLLSVLHHGSAGCRQLWDSFDYTDGDCSCNIALEAHTFMAAFDKLCAHGSVSQRRAHWLITAMLEIDPEWRFDIETVRAHLGDL